MNKHLNELTFVAKLGTLTTLRAKKADQAGTPVLVASGNVEERQEVGGVVRRCDIRLSSHTGRHLASGEVKRPEVPAGRDARGTELRDDARRKAVARGLPYYFTCNMAEVVLFEVAARRDQSDKEVSSFRLAEVTSSREVSANWDNIKQGWDQFLDDLEERLRGLDQARPSVTTGDVIVLRDALYAVVEDALPRALRRLRSDPSNIEDVRAEAGETFGYSPPLDVSKPAEFEEDVRQLLVLGVFVIAQKLILYRVLEDTGPRRIEKYRLDPLDLPSASTDPLLIRKTLEHAVSHAIGRSGDYETAFLPDPFESLIFVDPLSQAESDSCRVGEVWRALLDAVQAVAWESITRNLIGFLYEAIVEPRHRHELGQYYTPEDVVDILVTFAVRDPSDLVLDPASGGGSFVRSAYQRLRALGADHDGALVRIWGVEVAAFAAELSTITLATADVHAPAAYPRVILADFFKVHPGATTELEIPDEGKISIPHSFDAVVGNPPYISYRRIGDQANSVGRALMKTGRKLKLPRFSGKSDLYTYFLAHSSRFLKPGGRLAFVVSSSILFSDYGIPLIQFLGRHFKIRGVVDSMVERWFPDADTNTVLLLLEREDDDEARAENHIRFIRMRRPLGTMLPAPGEPKRRGVLEDLVDELLDAPAGDEDPRFRVSELRQGAYGGLAEARSSDDGRLDLVENSV